MIIEEDPRHSHSGFDGKTGFWYEHLVKPFRKDIDHARVYAECVQTIKANQTHNYGSDIERKSVNNTWSEFGPETLAAFELLLNSLATHVYSTMVRSPSPLSKDVYMHNFFPDYSLHGGGIHVHGPGQHLNPHIDYEVHPKLQRDHYSYMRLANAIFYVNPRWKPEWGGGLKFWAGSASKPDYDKEMFHVKPEGGDVVIFPTGKTSKGYYPWHGVEAVECPDGEYRISLAVFYLKKVPREHALGRNTRAMFYPRPDQLDDPKVFEAIKNR